MSAKVQDELFFLSNSSPGQSVRDLHQRSRTRVLFQLKPRASRTTRQHQRATR